MCVARLRRADARGRRVGQCVTVQDNDPFKIGRDRLSRGKAPHSGAGDNGPLRHSLGH